MKRVGLALALLLVPTLAGAQLPANWSMTSALSGVTGTLPCSFMPALTGSVTTQAGSCATTVAADDDVPEVGDFGALVLTGDITSSGVATTIGAAKVTNSMLASGAYMMGAFHTFCTGGSMAASSTVFMPGFGGVLTTCTGLGTTRTAGTPVSAGTIKNLRVNMGTAGKAGDAVTVEIAGVASALTCTFGASTSCSDVIHSAAVAAGNVLTVKVATGGSETAANIAVYFELWN